VKIKSVTAVFVCIREVSEVSSGLTSQSVRTRVKNFGSFQNSYSVETTLATSDSPRTCHCLLIASK
jgi:hypothetical protein